jgi:signal peptide peptidase SppA
MTKPSKFAMPHSFGHLTDIPNAVLDDFFGIWAIEESRFRQAVERYQGINLVAHIEAHKGQVNHLAASADADAQAASGDRRMYPMEGDGVAVVRLRGPMMKYVSSMNAGASTVFARRQIRQAVEDDQVGAILLEIDSPGGTVSGTMDLAQEVAKAAAKKPVYAFVEDLTASAAMWVASQATRIYANNPTALVGSIGTYAVLYDMSQRAEDLGIKVHVIKAGDHKGTGVAGTEITEEQLADAQRIVDALNAEFLNGVAQGRGLSVSEVQKIADGRVHPAAEAVGIKLVDAIKSYSDVIADLSSQSRLKRRSYSMTMENDTCATLQELKQEMPEADAAFLLEQLEKGATVSQSLGAYAAKVRAENEALRKQMAESDEKHKQELEKASVENQAGVEPLGASGFGLADGDHFEVTQNPVVDFENAVMASMARQATPDRQKAIIGVAQKHPALYREYMLARNSSQRTKRQLQEKYELENASS